MNFMIFIELKSSNTLINEISPLQTIHRNAKGIKTLQKLCFSLRFDILNFLVLFIFGSRKWFLNFGLNPMKRSPPEIEKGTQE